MHLSSIHHIAIIVSDYAAAKDFYVNKLGFQVIRENYRPERRDWKLDLRLSDTVELEIFAEENPPKRVNHPEACGLRHLAFHVDDVEAVVGELAELGISCEPVRTDTYTGKKMTFFFDPDGLPLELHECRRREIMKKTALLIMAAGIGSRFGTGIKQLEPVGLRDEIIMDYSVHDAIQAGFNKIVFVIRRDIEKDFRERIGERVEKVCRKLQVETAYAFQDLADVPDGCQVPAGRTKPWGTGQAVLAAKDLIHEPFAVINADDYYGKEAFVQLHDWLAAEHEDSAIAMAGFILKNTLSDNGGVTRGVCRVAEDGRSVLDVTETGNIVKTVDPGTGAVGAEADGVKLDPESYVSMNFWGFPAREGCDPAFLEVLEKGFGDFFAEAVPGNPMKAEYLLPVLIGGMLREGSCTVEALETRDRWFGVTYKEDKEMVVESFRRLIADGVYREELYSDLG